MPKPYPIQIDLIPTKAEAENALAKTLQKYCEDDLLEFEGSEDGVTVRSLIFSRLPNSRYKGKLLRMQFHFAMEVWMGFLSQEIHFDLTLHINKDGKIAGAYSMKTGRYDYGSLSFDNTYVDVVNKIEDTFDLALEEIENIKPHIQHLKPYVVWSAKKNMDLILTKAYKERVEAVGWHYEIYEEV